MNAESPVDTNFPDANKVIGFVKESDGVSEKRVALTPAVIAKLRKLGFRVVMQSGAGTDSNFSDGAYTEKGGAGGVKVVPTAEDVFAEADVIVKVTEPSNAELDRLRKGQICVGIWNMFKKEALLERAVANKEHPSVFNMALIPRISRTQIWKFQEILIRTQILSIKV